MLSMIRRAIDIVGGCIALALMAPVMALAMLAIRIESRGHAIYRQRRVGKDGMPFELPNLLNVVRGDMSFIGPRPTIPVQVAQYTERQRGRLAIRPGITGWAQVNGRASLPWSERIELDLYYIEHRSLAFDLRILGRTLAIVFGGSGLYKGQTGGWEDG